MRPDHVMDELSAYIDGEARDPERIARHLQGCPECRRRHEELRRLSAHLKALRPPDVRPEFATRVMAKVAERRTARNVRWLRLGLRAAMAGITVLIVVGVAIFLRGSQAPRGPVAPPVGTAVVPDEATLAAEMERRISDDPDAEALAMEAVGGFEEGEGVSSEDLLAELSETGWLSALIGVWEEEDDLDTLIDTLSPDELGALKELIRKYEQEGHVI